MAEQSGKEIAVKLTADTKQFIADLRAADKAVQSMEVDIAGAEKRAQELSDTFKKIEKVFIELNSNYISKGLSSKINIATIELVDFLDKVKKMSSASGINDVAKGAKDAAKAMSGAGKDVALSVKDTSKAAADASKKIEEAEKTAATAGKKIKDDLKSATEGAGLDKPFKVTAAVDGKEIESTIKDAQKTVDDAGTNHSKTLPFQVDASVDGKSFSATVKDVSQLGKKLSEMTDAAGHFSEMFSESLGKDNNSFAAIGKGVESVGQKTKEVAEEMVKDYQEVGKAAAEASETMAKSGGIIMSEEEQKAAEQSKKKLEAELEAEKKRKAEKKKDGRSDAKKDERDARSLNNDWLKARGSADEAQRLASYMDAAANAGRGFTDMVATIRGKLNPAYAESERRVSRLSARQNELKRQLEKIANTRYHSAEWNDYTKEMQRARAAMNALEVEQRNLETKMHSGMFGQQEAEEAKKKYNELGASLEQWRKRLDEVTAARAALKEGNGKPGSENPEGAAIAAEIIALQRQIDMTRASGSGLFRKLRKHAHSESKKITTILKNTYKQIKSFFSNVFHLSNSRSAESGLKRIASAFTRLWGMFRTRLKRRFISAVFADAKNDMLQLAKAFPSMNESISNVVNSAKALGAQLISILQPIITAVGPLVTKVLDAATVAADKIAQFSAKLFGQDLYGKATKGNYDFVKSMDETTSSVNSANDALSDYSSNLLGFDKLNQLQAVDNGTGATIKAEETEPVKDNAFNRWAEELKENWDNKDWRGFGTTLANGLNDAVDWINNQDWDALSGKVTGFISNIQEAFNGFIEAFKAEGVGHLIGHIGNLLIDAWNQLVKPVEEGGFDFKTLGQKIGTMLVTALQDIKWDKAGVAFGNTGSRLVEMFRGILETKFTDAEGDHTLGYGIGKAISTFITNALKTINTDDWATIIADLFENLLDMFIQIFSSGPELGTKIAEILNKSLKKIPANKLGEAISGLSRTFNSLIENIHWGDVVSKLGEAFASMDFWSVIKSIFYLRIGKNIGSFFNNMLGGIFGGGTKSGGGLGSGLLGGLLGRLFGKGTGGGGTDVATGGGGILRGLFGKLVGGYNALLSAHPYSLGLTSVAAALWGGNQIGRAVSQDKIDEYHEFQKSGQVLDTSQWNDAQRFGAKLVSAIDTLTGAFDGFSTTYSQAMQEEAKRNNEEYNTEKFYENMANGYSEAKTNEARERNGDAIDELISSHILKDYQNNLSRAMLEERYGMTVYDMNRRYGLNLEYDGQTSALTETVSASTTAMQKMETNSDTSTQAMVSAVEQMKNLFNTMAESASEGQTVTLMIDGYKFGEFVLKQLGTLMHVRTASA